MGAEIGSSETGCVKSCVSHLLSMEPLASGVVSQVADWSEDMQWSQIPCNVQTLNNDEVVLYAKKVSSALFMKLLSREGRAQLFRALDSHLLIARPNASTTLWSQHAVALTASSPTTWTMFDPADRNDLKLDDAIPGVCGIRAVYSLHVRRKGRQHIPKKLKRDVTAIQ